MNGWVLFWILLAVGNIALFIVHAVNNNQAGMVFASIGFLCGAISAALAYKEEK